MELRFDGCGYAITGTPEEMWAFLTLEDKEPEQEPAKAEQTEPKAEQEEEKTSAPAPQPKRRTVRKEVGWGKARALLNAGWTYKKIADELKVSQATVFNHLREEPK